MTSLAPPPATNWFSSTRLSRSSAPRVSAPPPSGLDFGGKNRRSWKKSLFVVGSVALHFAAVLSFSGTTRPAHAKIPDVIAIEFIEMVPEAIVEEKPEPMPLGELEAPIKEEMPVPVEHKPAQRTPAPVSPTPSPRAQTSNEPVSEAPKVLTSNNPYASSSTVAFTSGSASRPATKTVVVGKAPAPKAAPGFGVENGQANASLEAKKRLNAWLSAVRAKLANHGARSYPRRAQKAGQQGTPKVAVSIDAQGRIIATSLASASGYAALDRAAVSNISSARTVPAPPAGVGPQRLTIDVTFRLH